MQGKPIENVKSALSTSLLELRPGDYFDIIAFNDELHSFSSCMEPATEDVVENAINWMNKIFVAEGGTDIMLPLNEVTSSYKFLCITMWWLYFKFMFTAAG